MFLPKGPRVAGPIGTADEFPIVPGGRPNWGGARTNISRCGVAWKYAFVASEKESANGLPPQFLRLAICETSNRVASSGGGLK